MNSGTKYSLFVNLGIFGTLFLVCFALSWHKKTSQKKIIDKDERLERDTMSIYGKKAIIIPALDSIEWKN